MESDTSRTSDWAPDQLVSAKRWVRAWQEAGPLLEQVRRWELRKIDPEKTIALLCGPANYRLTPRAPKPTSGLIEQQRWFRLAKPRD